MLKRTLLFIMFVLVLAAFLGAGCLNNTPGTGNSGSSGSSAGGSEMLKGESSLPYAPSDVLDSSATAQYQTKEGSMTIKVPEGTLQAKFEAAKALLVENGAQLSDIRYYEYSDKKEYHITAKIVPSNFDNIAAALKDIGEVKDLSVSLDDVTQQYTDLETRIKNREIELDRLHALYNQTGNISDLLQIEQEITRVETDLEILKQDKQYLFSRIERSTLTISIYEDAPSTQYLTAPLAGIGNMFFGALGVGLTFLVAALGFLLPGLIVLAILWFAYTKLVGGGQPRSRKSERGQIPLQ